MPGRRTHKSLPSAERGTTDDRHRPPITVLEGLHEPVVVELSGEHDLATREAVRVALEPLRGNVVVDLCRCSFVDVTVLGLLLAKRAELARAKYTLTLHVPETNVAISRILSFPCFRDHLIVRTVHTETARRAIAGSPRSERVPLWEVKPRNGRWAVQRKGTQRADSMHRDFDDAIARAVDLSRRYHGDLRIRARNGRVVEERSFRG
jgi:hypothetical protein